MKVDYNTFRFVHQIIVLSIISVFFISSCTGQLSTHGTLNLENNIDKILINNLEKAEVEILLGPPSTISTFDEKKWYYINNQIAKVGIFKPEVVSHRVYEVIFDEENRVKDIKEYDLSNINKIDYNEKITETKGNETSILETIIRSKKTRMR